ncbi:MAG TPA: hypothetical protein PLD59_00785 [Tepidisphaeraceae bacterium]|nr:hypothetical protein [Tepidisphaeraceae bacterium]
MLTKLLFLCTLLAATQPSSELHTDSRAESHAVSPDPRDTLKEVMASMAAQDATRLLAVCDVPTPAERSYVESAVKVMLAGRRLADAATKTYGPAGDAIAKGPIAATDEADIPAAAVSVIGDRAELLMPGHTQPLKFRLVDGGWKLGVSDFAGSAPRDLDKQTALSHLFATALAEAAEEIEEGRYARVDDAEAAIRQKLNQVLMKSLASTPPTPATQPAAK